MPTPLESAADPGSQVKVEVNEPASLQQGAGGLGLAPGVLQSAVHAVEPRVDQTKDHLNGGGARDQENI